MSGQPSPLALVTGAGRGIGLATARRLAGEGLRVIALDRDPAALDAAVQAIGPEALIPCVAELTDTAALVGVLAELVERHGPVTRLVNNAGVWPGNPIIQLDDEAWQQNLAVNLTAPFVVLRALVPAMIRAGGGGVVNVASRNAFRSSTGNAGYDASKAGLVGLTRTAAGELARHRIRVNAVCPGVIETPGEDLRQRPLFSQAYQKQIPLGRFGRPEEIASVICFLLGEGASYLTGQAIVVDGGQLACQDNDRLMEIVALGAQDHPPPGS
ncbi:MAG: SDR family oxidoreductase [Candidatus Latescibacteria bacterium]|nr:SDR family oxidoreductase [Candidatus Latescibacterota bacterium]